MTDRSVFQFKQFDLIQSEQHLKVTTEATLLAAWINTDEAKSILDIGAGTGVLSLMLAQKSEAKIDAVELQLEMAEICKENFNSSPWKDRLSCHFKSIQEFNTAKKYDLIVCNPPFFFAQTQRKQIGKNRAMHNTDLSLEDLMQSVLRLLAQEGRFYLLLPPEELREFEKSGAGNGLYLKSKLQMIHKAGKPVLREAACFVRHKNSIPKTEQLIMRNKDESYSKAYRDMLKEYLVIF